MKNKIYKICVCGVGGQGIIKTSLILGEATLNNNENVVMSEIHGMSQRGGVVSTELKIGDAKSPIIEEGEADIIIAFEPVEALRTLEKTNKDTVIILNTHPIIPATISNDEKAYPKLEVIIQELENKVAKVYPIDAYNIALEAGHLLSINMALLGATSAIKDFPVNKELIIESMKNNLSEKTIPINMASFNNGYESCKKLQ
ncbi:MAG: indolepyruvate oxidoreductase subunit beta [Methanobacteriaceae archaeon]|nr:indolepyruvate oxidoreductase subunit beta [Methanobacteriaceae archaeon]